MSPLDVLRAVTTHGRVELDTADPGQATFQALLWDLLFSRGRDHPWNHRGDRSFPDLALYISWVAAQPRGLGMLVSVAPRVANYLLPRTQTFPDGVHFGIPGLRIEQVTGRSLHLLHLPTRGRLEIRDTSPGTSRSMRSRLRWETDVDEEAGSLAFWQKAGITPAEEAAAHHWAEAPCAPLRSALMVRANFWWRQYPHTAELIPPRRSNTSRCLQRRNGRTCTEMGNLLVSSAIRIPDATHSRSATPPPPAAARPAPGLVALLGGHGRVPPRADGSSCVRLSAPWPCTGHGRP
ncbi:hypothetical protein ACFU7Y_22660, partial [Kitasatospora sp. NPDC057542]|uniref:hypothetical protein n=1 Tax=Kitasatospora sp. NPDC057542 TaxID=3346162 RepID=UPI0036BCB83D